MDGYEQVNARLAELLVRMQSSPDPQADAIEHAERLEALAAELREVEPDRHSREW